MQTYLKNGYIVTMGADETVYDGGGVAVCGDKIAAVGDVAYCIGENTKVIDAEKGQIIDPILEVIE